MLVRTPQPLDLMERLIRAVMFGNGPTHPLVPASIVESVADPGPSRMIWCTVPPTAGREDMRYSHTTILDFALLHRYPRQSPATMTGTDESTMTTICSGDWTTA